MKKYAKLYTHHPHSVAEKTLKGKTLKMLVMVELWVIFFFIASFIFYIFYHKYVLFYSSKMVLIF